MECCEECGGGRGVGMCVRVLCKTGAKTYLAGAFCVAGRDGDSTVGLMWTNCCSYEDKNSFVESIR